jgi:hypothetical protein
MDQLIRITTALAVVAVAVVAAVISYQHAFELVRSHGIPCSRSGRSDLSEAQQGAAVGQSGRDDVGAKSAEHPDGVPLGRHERAADADWAQGGVRVQRAADLGGRRSIVGAVSPSIPRLRRSSTMSSCRGWPNVSR